MLYYHQRLFMPRVVRMRTAQGLGNGYLFGNDFYQVWLTSHLMRQGGDLYGPAMTREIQVGIYGRPLDPSRPDDPLDRRIFAYPAFTALLFWPAAQFPFAPERIAVVCLLAALTFASVPLWLGVLDWNLSRKWLAVVLLFTLSSYSALEALSSVQLGLLVTFLLAASILVLQRNRLLLAGILMAITTIKPQVTGLAILYFLLWSLHDWRVRGRFCVGFFSTLTLLVGASLAVMPHWIQSWTHTLLAYRHYAPPPLVTEVLTSPLGSRWTPVATFTLTAASIVAAIVLAWRNRAVASSSFAFCLTLSLLLAITTITILPGQAVYDHLILLPGILLLVRHRVKLRSTGPLLRLLLPIGALVLFWPWIAALALILLRPWMPPAIFDSSAVFSLPIRAAASLPFAVFALIAWTVRVSALGNRGFS